MDNSYNGLGKNTNGTDAEYDDLNGGYYEDLSRGEDPELRAIRMAIEDGDYSDLEGLSEEERAEIEKKLGIRSLENSAQPLSEEERVVKDIEESSNIG